jgi:predicted nucleotide-binding protein
VESIGELRDIATLLESVAQEAAIPDLRNPLDLVKAAAERAGAAWSGSSFGYHSRVYYQNFDPPPAGARFNSEWGFMPVAGNTLRGDWVEWSLDEAQAAIISMAGNPDLSPAKAIAEHARQIFDQQKITLISILSSELSEREDEFLRSILNRAVAMEPLSSADAAHALIPDGMHTSRDRSATSEGLKVAPHQVIYGEVVELIDAPFRCTELAQCAVQAAEYLARRSTRRAQQLGDRVFIGHGRSPLWRELKDFVQDRLGLPWDEFNRVPIAGVANIARLSEMLDDSSIAFLVLTAEDESRDGSLHARQNVIHEAGLFQGRLGFLRAIILIEESCEEFSNIQGLGQLRFPVGKISSIFEDVRQIVEREGLIPEG